MAFFVFLSTFVMRNFQFGTQIKPNDLLPKTICQSCMDRVEQHHELMLKLKQHEHVFTNSNSTRIARTATTEIASTRQNSTTNNDDNDKDSNDRC